jgi:hypothetical protein
MLHTNLIFAMTIALRQFNATLLEKYAVYIILNEVSLFTLLILKQNNLTKTNESIPTQ